MKVLKIKVVGEVKARGDFGNISNIPQKTYDAYIDGVVRLQGTIRLWTLFLKNFQEAIEEKKIEIIEE